MNGVAQFSLGAGAMALTLGGFAAGLAIDPKPSPGRLAADEVAKPVALAVGGVGALVSLLALKSFQAGYTMPTLGAAAAVGVGAAVLGVKTLVDR